MHVKLGSRREPCTCFSESDYFPVNFNAHCKARGFAGIEAIAKRNFKCSLLRKRTKSTPLISAFNNPYHVSRCCGAVGFPASERANHEIEASASSGCRICPVPSTCTPHHQIFQLVSRYSAAHHIHTAHVNYHLHTTALL